MFKRLDHIECTDNADQPKLVVGAFYSVKDIWTSRGEMRVEVYGHEGQRFRVDAFRPASRDATTTDFDRAFATAH